MESVGGGGECWLELPGSLTDSSYDAGTGCVFVCMCVFACVCACAGVWDCETGISVTLS